MTAELRLTQDDAQTLVKALGVALLDLEHLTPTEREQVRQLGDKALAAWWGAKPTRCNA